MFGEKGSISVWTVLNVLRIHLYYFGRFLQLMLFISQTSILGCVEEKLERSVPAENVERRPLAPQPDGSGKGNIDGACSFRGARERHAFKLDMNRPLSTALLDSHLHTIKPLRSAMPIRKTLTIMSFYSEYIEPFASMKTFTGRFLIWFNFPLSSICWWFGITQITPLWHYLPKLAILYPWYLSNFFLVWIGFECEKRAGTWDSREERGEEEGK